MTTKDELDRLYEMRMAEEERQRKLKKAEEERQKKLKKAERERQKKLKKKEQELIVKLQSELMKSMYEKYLKVSKKTSSEFTMLDYMAHAKRSNVELISEERLNDLRAKENKLNAILQSQQPIYNQGGNVTNTPTGE